MKNAAFTGTSFICTGHCESRLCCFAAGADSEASAVCAIALTLEPGQPVKPCAAGLRAQLLALGAEDGGFVKRGGLTLNEADGVHRAVRQAVAEPVAVIIAHELCLAVHQCKRALLTSIDAQAAAGAFSLVYMNDASFHAFLHLCVVN